HQVTPKECHLQAVKRIFQYLKGHPKLGIWYSKYSLFDLVAYSDSDYSSATQDRKSTTGGCQVLGRRLISWQCKKQTIVATSTTEVEYVATASGCGQVMVKTSDEGTKILATVDGKPRTISESSIMRNLKLNDEAGISSLPDAELFENLTLMGESNLKCIKTLDKELQTLKLEKDGVDGKLAGLLKASKKLDNLIESQRSDKVKDGVGYNAVPPPVVDLYLSPKKDLSWTGLLEFTDDTVTDYSRPSPTVESTSEDGQNRNSSASENEEPTDSILSKPAVKFVKAVDRPAERPTTNKAETVKKPTTQQLGPDLVLKKKACFNCGDFSHHANDCRKRVQRETTRSQNHAYMSPSHRSAGHKPHGAPMRPSYRPVGYRTHDPPMRPMRSNMNGARPNRTSFNKQAHSYSKRPFQETTQELIIILIQRVQSLEKELKARTSKVDRGRSRPVMVWVPKRD
nr:putative ribonuclease H-like domain-containing protein [Tanacetum cinerariifolium]